MPRISSFPLWQVKLRAVSHEVTWFLGRRFPKTFPFVFVLGHAKSGTTWACQLLADVLQLPYPRYSLLPVGFPAVVHGHAMVDTRYPKGVYVMRDGRDVLVSTYFFSFRNIPDVPNPPLPRRLLDIYGPIRSKADVHEHLGKLIEHMARLGKHRGSWAAHVRSYFDTPGHHLALLRYEDLLDDGPAALSRAIEAVTGAAPDPGHVDMALRKFDFAQQRVRKLPDDAGEKFLRKGRSGDWRTYFTPELVRQFDRHFGETLVAAGYEPDRSWVETVTTPEPRPEPEAARA